MNNPLVIAAVGAVAVVGAIVVNVTPWLDEAKDPPKTAGRTAEQTAAARLDAARTGKPSFDVVRVDPFGDAVMAGRALPGSTVVILDNGQPIGQIVADGRGEWVFVPTAPLKPGSRQLTLEMRVADAAPVPSDDVVVLVVPERDKDVAGRPATDGTGALALKMPRGKAGGTLLQSPADGGAAGGLRVDVVDYDDAGRLAISGRGRAGAVINLYLDDAFVGRAEVDAGGAWRISPEAAIKPGLYTLRADQTDAAGKVTARVSMPFSRAEPMTNAPPEPFVIVQPGNSLWRLARRAYGEGVHYALIYDANKSQIKDPDLIYPGQVFALPATN